MDGMPCGLRMFGAVTDRLRYTNLYGDAEAEAAEPGEKVRSGLTVGSLRERESDEVGRPL